MIEDAKQRKTCLGNESCRFILAKAFNTGEALPLSDFYSKNGFIPTSQESMLYFPIEGNYEAAPVLGSYEPLLEDRDKAVIFYGPACQFSYSFAKKIEEIIRQVAPSVKIEIINEWQKPEEAIRRRNWWLIVNAKPIHTFFMETEKFKKEITQAIGCNS